MTRNRPTAGREIRQGSTLLEVLLATGLFFAGIAAISQLLRNGSQAALRSELEIQACLRCESIVNRLLVFHDESSIAREVKSIAESEIDPLWDCKINTVTSSLSGTLQLQVIVEHRQQPQLGRFEITRLIRSKRT